MERAVMCPQCGAPLTPHRFARSIVCPYCGVTVRLDESAVSAARFHEAFRIWNSPESYYISSWLSVGDSYWALDKTIAHGEISEVYTVKRARWPTELGVMKVLRDRGDIARFDNEWNVLQALNASSAPGAETFARLIPQPIVHGDVTTGVFASQRISIFRWAGGFHYNFDQVIQAYPQGIPPQASIWIWRRILEVLGFIHASGIAHGAVVPAHLLLQEHEHGVRLVGYTCAGRLGDKRNDTSSRYDPFIPQLAEAWSTLSETLDLAMSARCISAILGGNPATGAVPVTVPAPLEGIIRRVALAKPTDVVPNGAWAIRQELGEIAKQVFGPPKFLPIAMPT